MLETFLADLARTPFVWGETDCAMTVANWWRCAHGTDPAPDLRGSYSDAAGCSSVLAARGGVSGVVGEIASRVGASETSDPQPGDFGVICVHGLEFAAVLSPSGRWMVKGLMGIAGYRCAPLKAWSL